MAEVEAQTAPAESETQTPTHEQAQPDATGEKAERMFTKAEVEALVRDRLAGAQRKADEQAAKARADAEAKALREQGEYKTLYEKLQAELDAERQRTRELELAGLRRDVAAKFQLPDGLARRLQGETLEELEADAQDLLAAIPKPQAPNINAGNAPANVGVSHLGGLSPQEFAARFGVRADLLGKQ